MEKVTRQDLASICKSARMWYQRKFTYWQIWGKDIAPTWSQAMKHAWNVYKQNKTFNQELEFSML